MQADSKTLPENLDAALKLLGEHDEALTLMHLKIVKLRLLIGLPQPPAGSKMERVPQQQAQK